MSAPEVSIIKGQNTLILQGGSNTGATIRGFEYGEDANYGTTTEETGDFGIENFSTTVDINSLSPGVTYHYRAYATNSSGTGFSPDATFRLSIPAVSNNYANANGPSDWDVNGNITSDGGGTTSASGFEYGTDTNYGNITYDGLNYNNWGTNVGSWDSYLSGLSCGTTYHYRAWASNEYGTGYAPDNTFTTWMCPRTPIVSTEYAYQYDSYWSILAGNVISDGADYVWQSGIEYGLDTNYGGTDYNGPTWWDGLGQSQSGTWESWINLSCATTYHYRAWAVNNYGYGYGPDRTFTTRNCPTAPVMTTGHAQRISDSESYLWGTVLDGGDYVQQSGFEWGTDTNYGNMTYDGPTWFDGTGQYSYDYQNYIFGLSCGITYHYRAWAVNNYGTSYGNDKKFDPCGNIVPGSDNILSSDVAISGVLTSSVLDTTPDSTSIGYNSIMWKGALGGTGANEGKVRFQLAASADPAGPWEYYGGDTCGPLDWFDSLGPDKPIELKGSSCLSSWNNKRYYKYKVQICSNDCVTAGPNTPTVEKVIINWAP